MTDKAPEQLGTPETNPPVQQTGTGTTPPVDWEARYKGQQAALQEAVEARKNIAAQLAEQNSQLEQLQTQLGTKANEFENALLQKDNQLQSLTEAQTQSAQELLRLRALENKLKVAKELGRPELLPILDNIPNMDDPEKLKSTMTEMATWADNLVKQREQILLSGVVPLPNSVNETVAQPQSYEAWETHINGLPIGSPERAQAMDRMYEFLAAQNKQ